MGISDEKENKKLWSYIKSKKKDNIGTSDLKSGQILIQDPEIKANMFNAFFTKVFSNPSLPQPRIEHVCPNPMPKITVSKAGVLNLLLKIKENKATGPDGIPGNLLKICVNEIAEVLTLLFSPLLTK